MASACAHAEPAWELLPAPGLVLGLAGSGSRRSTASVPEALPKERSACPERVPVSVSDAKVPAQHVGRLWALVLGEAVPVRHLRARRCQAREVAGSWSAGLETCRDLMCSGQWGAFSGLELELTGASSG